MKISRRSDGGKSTKMSFKNVRYGSQKTVSKHLKRGKNSLNIEIWAVDQMTYLVLCYIGKTAYVG